MQILDGKSLSGKIKDDLKNEMDAYVQTPILTVISIGEDDASKIYIRNKKNACEYIGMSFLHIKYQEDIPEEKVIKKIKELNKDTSINGIILQLPIPKHYDVEKIINTIDPSKDVDGLTNISQGKLFNNHDSIIPCTPKGIMELLDYYKIPIESKHVVIVGRSNLVSKPLMIEFLKRDATVTICHSKTKNLSEYTKQADILVSATGHSYLINRDMVKSGATVIDVGISRVDGTICGDVNPNVSEVCSYLTPVPGGVGPMTVTMLLKNTFEAYKKQNGVVDISTLTFNK